MISIPWEQDVSLKSLVLLWTKKHFIFSPYNSRKQYILKTNTDKCKSNVLYLPFPAFPRVLLS